MKFQTRNDLPFVLNELKLTGLGVEVGVQKGYFAREILTNWPGFLYLVDTWRNLEGYTDAANVSDAEHEENYQETLRQCERGAQGKRFTPMRMTSLEAAAIIAERIELTGPLDFVYLDADHSYESVKADIEAWFPLVKSGGVIAGHDYIKDGVYPFGTFGVQRAVKEFFGPIEATVTVTHEEFPSWLVVK